MPTSRAVSMGAAATDAVRTDLRQRFGHRVVELVSHSEAEGRSWDAGVMGDEDVYAFLRVVVAGDEVQASTPSYFRTMVLNPIVQHPRLPGERHLCRWESGKTYRYGSWRKWPDQHLYVAPGSQVVAGETIVAGIVKAATGLE